MLNITLLLILPTHPIQQMEHLEEIRPTRQTTLQGVIKLKIVQFLIVKIIK